VGVGRSKRRLRAAALLLAGTAAFGAIGSGGSLAASVRPAPTGTPTPAPQAAVISVTVIPAQRAAAALKQLFPHARVQVDRHANAVLVVAPPDELQQMRTVVQGIDVRNPQTPTAEVVPLHVLKAQAIIGRLHGLYPAAQIEVSSTTALLVRAAPSTMTEIKALISALDITPPPTPAPTSAPADAVRVMQARPRDVARALEQEIPHLRAAVSGSTVILVGSQEDIQKAKTLAEQIDAPAFGTKYTQVYRLHNVDAESVADLIERSYPNLNVTVDKELNAISVYGSTADQQRIATAIAELDASQAPGQPAGAGGAPAYGDANIDVVQLEDAMPGQNGGPSTSAQDIANAVQQVLSGMASDLRISVPANSSEILLAGSPQSIRLAKDMIARIDAPGPLVVLDTEVLEVDENVARNIGLQLPGAAISSTWQEIQPTPDPSTGGPGRIGRFQSLTRTPIQFTAVLNLLLQKGNARVLADPRVTTISGHTATIRAGDTIGILTQSGGGVGTPVTQQLQTFNTGVTLDITPQVGPHGDVIVALHPIVNSLSGILNGVPQISTRDTQTVVQLHDNQTLAIGGLIQETLQHNVSKIPLLGDIPLLGRLFQNADVQSSRNELVIVVTPHIIKPGGALPPPGAVLPIPTPAPLPTLPPGTQLPSGALPAPHPEPAPTAVPTPYFSTPMPTAAPVPIPTPSAFASTNVFVYGSPPPNTYAADSEAPQIYYVQISPTLVRNGAPVQVFAVTTSNVRKVEIGYLGHTIALSQVAPSKWQASYTFSASGVVGQQTVMLQLNAYGPVGNAATIQIPVNVLSQ
jgi:type II secretory pathway component GspD/PulD (secretin)